MPNHWRDRMKQDTETIMNLARRGKVSAEKDYVPRDGLGSFKGKIIESWTVVGLPEFATFFVADWNRGTSYSLCLYGKMLFNDFLAIEFAKAVGFADQLAGREVKINE